MKNHEVTSKRIRARRPSRLLLVALALGASSAVSQAQTAKLVVRNAKILTMAENQRAPIVGYISVGTDGKVLTVAAGEPPATLKAASIIDAHGDYITPGFISSHSHVWQAAWRGLAQDKTTPGWGRDLYNGHAIRSVPEDTYWFCLHGSLDHLAHGITSVFDFALNRGAISNVNSDYDKAQFRAKADSGIRFEHAFVPAVVAPTANTPTAGSASAAAAPAAPDPLNLDQARARLKAFLEWTSKQPHAAQLLSVMLSGAPAGGEPVGAAKLMKEFHLGNEVHYLEAPDNTVTQRANFPSYMEGGLLMPSMFFGHFVHPDDHILQETAKAGVGMSWQPLSNGRLAAGLADIPKYLKMGIRVGMGVDGEASADIADPFENMRTGLYATRMKYEDATIMSPYQVMYLHTMGSADVMGVKDKVGSLETGKFADFVLINPARLGPVLEDAYANVVFVTGERDIDGVYVGGDLLVDHGKFLHQDFNKVQAESAKRVTTIN